MPGSRSEMNPKREIFLNKYTNFVDAFNRLRVSTPTILFDAQLQYGKHLDQWFESKSTSASITAVSSEASVLLQVSSSAGTMSATRQTRKYFRYQPGKSQLILATFGDFESAAYTEKEVGYGDTNNGIFLKSDEDGYYFVRRSDTSGTVADTAVEQADWNLDKLNGTGPSTITLDLSKVQILVADLEWLGVGRVRCGFVIDGVIVYAHEFVQANVGTQVYMRTANLPIRYHIQNTTSATATASLSQICVSVMSEGGESEAIGDPRATSNDTRTISCPTTAYQELIAIRPKTTVGGIPNRTNITFESVDVFATDQDIHWHLTWGGESDSSAVGWTDVGSTGYAAIQKTEAGTRTVGGVTIMEGYIAAATQGIANSAGGQQKSLQQNLALALNIAGGHPTVAVDGFSDQLSVEVKAMTAAALCGAALQWVEEK